MPVVFGFGEDPAGAFLGVAVDLEEEGLVSSDCFPDGVDLGAPGDMLEGRAGLGEDALDDAIEVGGHDRAAGQVRQHEDRAFQLAFLRRQGAECVRHAPVEDLRTEPELDRFGRLFVLAFGEQAGHLGGPAALGSEPGEEAGSGG